MRLQLPVPQLEGGLDGEVADLELVEPAPFVRELLGQHRDRPGTAGGQPGGGDPDRQRQEPAGRHDVQGGVPFGGHPLGADYLREELERLPGAHHVQVDQVRPGQADHPGTAGDQRRATLGAGQQRAHLGRVPGVVQQHQHPPAVQHRTVEGGPFLDALRDGGVRCAERPQERAEHGLRLGRLRAGALEVDVHLAVGEALPCRVRHMHRHRRLAHPADARDRGHRHHPALRRGQLVAQFVDADRASGEVGYLRGELCGADHRRRGAAPLVVGRCRQGGVRSQDGLVQLGQFRSRIDAQLLPEQPAGVRVDRERLGLPPAAVEREHQLAAQPLPQRVRGRQRGQLRDRLRVAAGLQVHLQPGLQQPQPPLLQTVPLGLGVGAGHPRQRFALPEAQGGVQQRPGPVAVAAVPGLVGPARVVLREREVEHAVSDPDRVAAGLAEQRRPGLGAEGLPQPGGVGAQRREGGVGRLLAPQRVHQLGGGGGAPPAQQQGGEQGALLR